MRAVIAARLDQLTPNARRLVELAAALGRDFAFDALAAASDLDEPEVVAALDELWQRRLVRERGANRYDLSHDRIRDVAYGETPPPGEGLLHRRIAQALELSSRADLDTVAGQLAAHLEAGGPDRRAVELYERAAEVASRVSAFAEAARHLSRALALLELEPPSRDRRRARARAPLPARRRRVAAVEGYSSSRSGGGLRAGAASWPRSSVAPRDVSLALNGSWSVSIVAGRIAEAIDLAESGARSTEPPGRRIERLCRRRRLAGGQRRCRGLDRRL